MMQSIATGSRVQYRNQTPVAWPELRRRGMAAIVEDALASAQYHLQVKIGADFAHQEFIRRCESILDLLGDDIANAPALREQVTTWKTLAEQRSLYSAVRRKLIGNLHFGPEVGVGPAKLDAPVISPWLEGVRAMADDLREQRGSVDTPPWSTERTPDPHARSCSQTPSTR